MKKAALLLLTIIFCSALHAQDSTTTIKSILDSKRYSFVPQSMTPMRGRSRQITYSYSLDVSGDSLVVYLPYVGRAYSAPIDPTTDAGYNFTSTDYDYSVKEGKKKRYEVTIKVKDKLSSQQFYLTVFDNKSASLQATSNDKDGISYNGYIKVKD